MSGIFGRAVSGLKKRPIRWRFLIRFVIFFAAAFLLWLATTPVCNQVLTVAAEIVVKSLDGYDITQSMTASGKDVIVRYQPSLDGKPHVINARNISFNVVFLLALIMAVPDIRNKRRLRILVLGIIFIFPVQVIRLSTYVLNFYGQHMQMDGVYAYPYLWRKALFYGDMTLTRIDSMLIPVVIWAGLFFYYKWYPDLIKKRAEPPEQAAGRSKNKKKKKKRDRR